MTLTGPRQYSFDEAASIIGEAIGRPVRHVRISDQQAVQHLVDSGASADVAQRLVELYDGIDHGPLCQPPPPDAVTMGTSLEQFAQQVLRPAIAGRA